MGEMESLLQLRLESPPVDRSVSHTHYYMACFWVGTKNFQIMEVSGMTFLLESTMCMCFVVH